MIPYLEKLADRTFHQPAKSHNLTRADITELFERLSHLAYNIVGYCACTNDYERTSKYRHSGIDDMLDAVAKNGLAKPFIQLMLNFQTSKKTMPLIF